MPASTALRAAIARSKRVLRALLPRQLGGDGAEAGAEPAPLDGQHVLRHADTADQLGRRGVDARQHVDPLDQVGERVRRQHVGGRVGRARLVVTDDQPGERRLILVQRQLLGRDRAVDPGDRRAQELHACTRPPLDRDHVRAAPVQHLDAVQDRRPPRTAVRRRTPLTRRRTPCRHLPWLEQSAWSRRCVCACSRCLAPLRRAGHYPDAAASATTTRRRARHLCPHAAVS